MNEIKVSIADLVSCLNKKKNDLIKSYHANGQYSQMISTVMRYWNEQESKGFISFDAKEKFEMGYWYELFDDLTLFISESDFVIKKK